MTSTPADPTPLGLWVCRALRSDGTTAWVAGVASGRHADGELVELPEAEAAAYVGDAALVVGRIDVSGRVTALQVLPAVAPDAPPVWWAEVSEPSASPPATNLLAFTGHGVEPGRLLDRDELRDTGATTGDQLGAIRLYPGTGEVDQLYVDPSWRRRHVGTSLTYAAALLTFVRDLRLLWGDGQRTSDGDRLVTASTWRHRAAPLTHLMPPMTPMDERIRTEGET